LRKKERYRRCGTAEVWIVSPETREILVYCAGRERILREGAELTSESPNAPAKADISGAMQRGFGAARVYRMWSRRRRRSLAT
jgi:Uma2 family endonuclease